MARLLENLYRKNPVKAESITSEVASLASRYTPDRSLEVYLASLPVESVLYRPKNPRFRRNWVFSHFRSAYRKLDNKIVLRGSPNDLPADEEKRIRKLLQPHANEVGAIVLNSLKDGPLFRAAYSLYKRAHHADKKVVAILAMTEPMQKFTGWLRTHSNATRKLLPFILVFNETEAHKFAKKLKSKTKPFMKDDELPDIRLFARMAVDILSHFDPKSAPRIYVTLGSRGSLGVDGFGNVVYVSNFSKRGATIYDTNACGDAYCAAVALLEWASRHGYENIAKINYATNNNPDADEMLYFMAVATAAAYCKATNRRGRVYAADVRDLLEHNHLASVILPKVTQLTNLRKDNRPDGVDENFRLREPAKARFVGVTEQLSRLIT